VFEGSSERTVKKPTYTLDEALGVYPSRGCGFFDGFFCGECRVLDCPVNFRLCCVVCGRYPGCSRRFERCARVIRREHEKKNTRKENNR
jgi:hypothetical protein